MDETWQRSVYHSEKATYSLNLLFHVVQPAQPPSNWPPQGGQKY